MTRDTPKDGPDDSPVQPAGTFPRLAVEPCGPLSDGPIWIPAECRHATVVHGIDGPMIVEFWTPAEMGRLPASARPAETFIVPGLGYVAFRSPACGEELEDVYRVAQEASSVMMVMRAAK